MGWVRTDSCGAKGPKGRAKDRALVQTEQHPGTALLRTSPEYTQPSLGEYTIQILHQVVNQTTERKQTYFLASLTCFLLPEVPENTT